MPNLTKDHFSIELNPSSQNVSVSIYSIAGKLVSEFEYGTLEGKQSIPMILAFYKQVFTPLKYNLIMRCQLTYL